MSMPTKLQQTRGQEMQMHSFVDTNMAFILHRNCSALQSPLFLKKYSPQTICKEPANVLLNFFSIWICYKTNSSQHWASRLLYTSYDCKSYKQNNIVLPKRQKEKATRYIKINSCVLQMNELDQVRMSLVSERVL